MLALNRKRSSFTKGGKVPSASEVSSYNREANEIQKRVTEANDRGNVGAQYQVMKEYAKKYGWNLTRKLHLKEYIRTMGSIVPLHVGRTFPSLTMP